MYCVLMCLCIIYVCVYVLCVYVGSGVNRCVLGVEQNAYPPFPYYKLSQGHWLVLCCIVKLWLRNTVAGWLTSGPGFLNDRKKSYLGRSHEGTCGVTHVNYNSAGSLARQTARPQVTGQKKQNVAPKNRR